jgi:hypothetical protein
MKRSKTAASEKRGGMKHAKKARDRAKLASRHSKDTKRQKRSKMKRHV